MEKTLQQMQEEARKAIDDYYTINPKYRTKDNLKDLIDSLITKAYEQGRCDLTEEISAKGLECLVEIGLESCKKLKK